MEGEGVVRSICRPPGLSLFENNNTTLHYSVHYTTIHPQSQGPALLAATLAAQVLPLPALFLYPVPTAQLNFILSFCPLLSSASPDKHPRPISETALDWTGCDPTQCKSKDCSTTTTTTTTCNSSPPLPASDIRQTQQPTRASFAPN